MKKVAFAILGIWSAISCFFSPVWVTMVFLNITGQIYQYDVSMDEGTAVILGIIMLCIWLLFALLPNIIFLKKMHSVGRKHFVCAISVIVFLCILCIGMCGWDITGFVTGTAEGEQALKQITQLEKGTVIPENIPQGGCRFTVTLIG